MSNAFWQAKIWGLLHDPLLKSLYQKKDTEGIWLEVLHELGNLTPSDLANLVKEADFIAAASDRPSWNDRERGSVDYSSETGLYISHLLSGEHQEIFINECSSASNSQDRSFKIDETNLIRDQLFPLLENLTELEKHKKAFWWLWRCFPVAVANKFGENIALLPADTRIPDGSVWSHNSLVAALASSLIGKKDSDSRIPHLAVFTLTPVQELIKASRKMRDFWSGSWLLHYLSAKICWRLAEIYGADSIVYPCLYAQPLIDHWLLEKYEDFDTWVDQPSQKSLLTAGFPNVLVLVLPKDSVEAAMQTARQTLIEEWRKLGTETLDFLQTEKHWMPELTRNAKSWNGWLESQWQTYWSSLPLVAITKSENTQNVDRYTISKGQGKVLKKGEELSEQGYSQLKDLKRDFLQWANLQNEYSQSALLPSLDKAVNQIDLSWNESAFNSDYLPSLAELSSYSRFNAGLWWARILTQLRNSLEGVKNSRTWELPTAFGLRSSISGLGAAVHPGDDWLSEKETSDLWEDKNNHAGLFDGIEKLNATEVLKRVLHKILPKILYPNDLKKQNTLPTSYPDLSSGAVGWLLQMEKEGNEYAIAHYASACARIMQRFRWAEDVGIEQWGIPWIKEHQALWSNPRLINASWLIDDYTPENPDPIKLFKIEDQKAKKKNELKELNKSISELFPPGSNPTDWYVLAAGDGDDMGKWLKGEGLKSYADYVASSWAVPSDDWAGFNDFLASPKRMGPATHAALSRALLDFSNQLVPYLTEQRYAGRLIYGGGDDVLAYTNLWEWDKWLWDIRQCFKGQDDSCKDDPYGKFDSKGDYWQWQGNEKANLAKRPLFTMGSAATISFGIVIAHHSVPLAIALENMWEAEKEGAKKHKSPDGNLKDAVQVRVIYGNGNVLKATCKFDTFNKWQKLLAISDIEPALFEQAATVWEQHPAPIHVAIDPWCVAFCDRREKLTDDNKDTFRDALAQFLKEIWVTTEGQDRDREVKNWLKLAAFIIRKRDIKIN